MKRRHRVAALAALGVALACTPEPHTEGRPHVFLITVDTLRADRLSAYGYDKETSPNLEDFAKDAILFENAVSQAPHTIPSLLQIMTSRYDEGTSVETDRNTLAEMLRAAGYQTVAVVDNPILEVSRDSNGLSRGFQRYYRNGPLYKGNAGAQHAKTKTPADAITAQAKRVLEQLDRSEPIFMWLHYFDPHDPYMPPYSEDIDALTWARDTAYTGDIRRTFLFSAGRKPDPDFDELDRQTLLDLYDAEIKYWDQSFGELIDHLKSQGLYEQSLIVVTSDHGEAFGEHGRWTHGYSLYDCETHVPLLVRPPGGVWGRRVSDPAQAIDVVPTVLSFSQAEPSGPLHGRNLMEPSAEPAYSFWRDWKAVRTDRWKLIQEADQVMLFDIQKDPNEQTNVADQEREVVRELVAAQKQRLSSIGDESARLRELSEQSIELLKAIGYVE
jgi:arylsulfatase A-like enzyme